MGSEVKRVGAPGGLKRPKVKKEKVKKPKIKKSKPSAPTPSKQGATVVTTKKGPADGVRKARTAYVLFSLAKRSEVKKTMPEGSNIIDLLERLTDLWESLDESQRKKWYSESSKDKLRYEKEVKEAIAKSKKGDSKKGKKRKTSSKKSSK